MCHKLYVVCKCNLSFKFCKTTSYNQLEDQEGEDEKEDKTKKRWKMVTWENFAKLFLVPKVAWNDFFLQQARREWRKRRRGRRKKKEGGGGS
jgi:hypothetical protein